MARGSADRYRCRGTGSDMPWISLKASNGQQCSVRDDALHTVLADRTGVGPWELFQVVDFDAPFERLVHGQTIQLQTRWARYLVADGSRRDQVVADRVLPRSWETFVIHKASGEGPIAHGDLIRLQAHDGRWVAAEGGGGGPLFANRSRPGPWETFEIGLWDILPVHLRTRPGGPFVVVEQDGRVRADRNHARAWETLTLIFPHREGGGLRSGDSLSVRTWDGTYLVAAGGGGGGLSAGQNRAEANAIFTISSRDGEEMIGHGSQVALQTSDGAHFVVAEGDGGGVVQANRRAVGPWETFVLELAERGPMPTAVAPTAAPAPQHPLATGVTPRRGTQPLQVILVAYTDEGAPADPSVTRAIVERAFYSDPTSIRAWFEMASLGQHHLANAGIVGPLTLPLPFSIYDENSPALPINATRVSAGRWETFRIEVVGGGPVETGREVRIRAFNDTYVMPRSDPGGILVSGGAESDTGTRFTIQHADGRAGTIEHGHSIYLRAANGRYVTAESGGGDLMHANRDVASTWETLTIERAGGPGPLVSGDEIHLRTAPGARSLYLCADVRGRWPDLFNVARKAGISLDALTRTDEARAMPLMLDFSGALAGGSKRSVGFTGVGGVVYDSPVTSIGLALQGAPRQGADQMAAIRSTVVHELCHQIYGLPDRYGHRKPIHGDVVVDRRWRREWEAFTIERMDGTAAPIGHDDRVHFIAHTGAAVSAPAGGDDLVNLRAGDPGAGETFIVKRIAGAGSLHGGDAIALVADRGRYVVAERGGGEWLAANRAAVGPWETFTIEALDGAATIVGGSSVALAHHGDDGTFYVAAVEDGRTSDAESLARGYETGGVVGTGCGGSFDIMDGHDRMVLMAAYDRIRRGWLQAPVLTPDDRLCVSLEPSRDHPQAVILWDPHFAAEWYVVENRLAHEGLDDVPSSGLIVTWI
ncbi:MAG: hypothetical protein KC731_14170, partial [Myxococcales bacterium]|nr:hypothetical protein [Myxococcales bacterium]